MNHVCDCGEVYGSPAAVEACQINNHNQPRLNAPRREVRTFAERMERALRANEHKGGWQAMAPEQLYLRVIEELDELLKEIQWNGDPEKIAAEAADAANFLMMIADNVTRRPTNPPRSATP